MIVAQMSEVPKCRACVLATWWRGVRGEVGWGEEEEGGAVEVGILRALRLAHETERTEETDE